MILNSITNQKFESHFSGSFEDISEVHIEEALPDVPKVVKDSAQLANEGGGAYVTDVYGGMPAVIPKLAALVDQKWSYWKERINNELSLDDLPLDTKNKEHYTWTNSATTPEELVSHAAEVKDVFLNIVNTCSTESGARVFAGENHKYLLKSISSIKDKVEKYSKAAGGNKTLVLQKINDPIRATIIAKDTEQLKKAIHLFKDELEKQEGAKFVFSNKWNMEYTNGYVGVHCNFVLQIIAEDGTKKNVRGELQFHLEQIKDGTASSADAISHLLYEQGRKEEHPTNTLFREQAMKSLFTGAMANISLTEEEE